jgi:hypothetical protein
MQSTAFAGLLHPQVDVNYNEELRKLIKAREYRPTADDQVLDARDIISDIWEQPTDRHLHVFVGLPSKVDGSGLPETCEWGFFSF